MFSLFSFFQTLPHKKPFTKTNTTKTSIGSSSSQFFHQHFLDKSKQKKHNLLHERTHPHVSVPFRTKTVFEQKRSTFKLNQSEHDQNMDNAEQAVLDGTSKWSCKIACTGKLQLNTDCRTKRYSAEKGHLNNFV